MSDREDIMRRWDTWRNYIADGGGGSWPRDEFESLLDAMGEVEDERDRLREEAEHHRKQAAYWHARYAEMCKNRGRLDALNKAPILGSGAKEAGQ